MIAYQVPTVQVKISDDIDEMLAELSGEVSA